MSTPEQLLAHIAHLEDRLAHAIAFRYGPMVARQGHDPSHWIVESDDGYTKVEFTGEDAKDSAIREAARRGRRRA